MSRPVTTRHRIEGPAGAIETVVDAIASPRGVALVAHPHPLFGGTMQNKVVTTLSRTLNQLGYTTARCNFRGVGKTEGSHDEGRGETDDLLTVVAALQAEHGPLPLVLAGFSFGAYVQTRVAGQLAATGTPVERLILVGTAAGHVEGARHYELDSVAADTLVIHGEKDTTVPLPNVLAWAGEIELPVVVVPHADHFFHQRLHQIRDIITRAFHGCPPAHRASDRGAPCT